MLRVFGARSSNTFSICRHSAISASLSVMWKRNVMNIHATPSSQWRAWSLGMAAKDVLFKSATALTDDLCEPASEMIKISVSRDVSVSRGQVLVMKLTVKALCRKFSRTFTGCFWISFRGVSSRLQMGCHRKTFKRTRATGEDFSDLSSVTLANDITGV